MLLLQRKTIGAKDYEEGDPEGLEDANEDIEDVNQLSKDFDESLNYEAQDERYTGPKESDQGKTIEYNEQSESESNREITMEEARNKIRIVFKYYTSFGDRLNLSKIQASKVIKLMKDSGVISKGSVTKTDVDILFKVNDCMINLLEK